MNRVGRECVGGTAVLAMRAAKVVKTAMRGGAAVASPLVPSGVVSFRAGAARAACAMRDDSNE